jgi:hypothetical protein
MNLYQQKELIEVSELTMAKHQVIGKAFFRLPNFVDKLSVLGGVLSTRTVFS